MEWILTPLAVLGVFSAIACLIYWAAGRVSPRVAQSEDKLMAYASGENIEGTKAAQTYSLFHVAFIFTVFHVAVILLALLPDSDDALVALVFLGGLAISAFALVTGGESDD
jgi:NADH:ubiquinone oxidoreductase subunit 3 (subunit A)